MILPTFRTKQGRGDLSDYLYILAQRYYYMIKSGFLRRGQVEDLISGHEYEQELRDNLNKIRLGDK